MTTDEPYETVYRGLDPVQTEILEDILTAQGFSPRLLGSRNAALLGAGQNIMNLRIEVPERLAKEAAELIESVVNSSETIVDDDDPSTAEELEPESEENNTPPRKSRLIALGAIAVLPGLSQVYGHRGWSGVILVFGLVFALVATLTHAAPQVFYLAFAASFVIDGWAGQEAVTDFNNGKHMNERNQVLFGVLQAAVAQTVAWIPGFIL